MTRALVALAVLMAVGCADLPAEQERCDEPSIPLPMSYEVVEGALSSINCAESKDTGYKSGNPFSITVVTVDGKKVEKDTANAYYVMAQAAAGAGVTLKVVSGFRTNSEQQYLYSCYVNCSCNNCNLAAKPGFSNHQSGHALDLNTSSGGVYSWLTAHGGSYGFKRTVPSEDWHWEWWGGGPGGGPCGAKCTPHCEGTKIIGADCGAGDCAAFGSTCVSDVLGVRCVFGACPALGKTKVCLDDHQIVSCSDGAADVGDCGAFGAYCSKAGASEARCVSVFCVDSSAQAPTVHDVCLPDGKRAHCDANGGLSEKLCPAGHLCVGGASATCKAPCTPVAEVCNGKDDDCDGTVDEGLGLGDPCAVGQGACETPGKTVCDGAGGTTCDAPAPDCDDGEPCTEDACDPAAGCLHVPVPQCCSGATPCGPGDHCDDGLCVVALCAPCSVDDDCRGGGRCLKLRSGTYCGIPCDDATCPLGTACMDLGGEGIMQCVPDSLDCACGPGVGYSCVGGSVARVDGCGRVIDRLDACDNGCAAAACCPDGTQATDGVCEAVQPPEGEDAGITWGQGGADGGMWGEKGPGAGVGDGAAAGDGSVGGAVGPTGSVEQVGSGGTSAGGCGAGGASGGVAWLGLALVLWWRRARGRDEGAGQGNRI